MLVYDGAVAGRIDAHLGTLLNLGSGHAFHTLRCDSASDLELAPAALAPAAALAGSPDAFREAASALELLVSSSCASAFSSVAAVSQLSRIPFRSCFVATDLFSAAASAAALSCRQVLGVAMRMNRDCSVMYVLLVSYSVAHRVKTCFPPYAIVLACISSIAGKGPRGFGAGRGGLSADEGVSVTFSRRAWAVRGRTVKGGLRAENCEAPLENAKILEIHEKEQICVP